VRTKGQHPHGVRFKACAKYVVHDTYSDLFFELCLQASFSPKCHETLRGIGLLESHGSQRLLLYGETLLLRSQRLLLYGETLLLR